MSASDPIADVDLEKAPVAELVEEGRKAVLKLLVVLDLIARHESWKTQQLPPSGV